MRGAQDPRLIPSRHLGRYPKLSQEPRKTFVMKFGGSSLCGPKEILQSSSIVKKYATNSNLVIVCSAMGDTTDHLLKAMDYAKHGKIEDARKTITEMRVSHDTAIEQTIAQANIKQAASRWVAEKFEEMDKVLLGISFLRDMSARSSDFFLAFGEQLSTFIMSSALSSSGVKTKYLTGGEAGIVTDENFGSAEPVHNVANERLKSSLQPLLQEGITPVVTGYIAETLETHEIITLGRGGSDYTATLIGAAIGADEIILWTDVDGILSADPKIVKNAKIVGQITYLEAMEMSAFGAKSMQPRALEPAAKKSIPVRIKNTFNPDSPGTLIVAPNKVVNGVGMGVKAVGSITNVGIINISGTSIVNRPGTAVQIFEILKELEVGIVMMSQSVSENNVSLVIKRDAVGKVVRAFRKELLLEDADGPVERSPRSRQSKFSNLDYEDDVSIVAVLGRGMIGTPGIAGRVFSTVAKQGINIRMIAQGSSEINISFVVKDSDRNRAVTAIHEEFRLGIL
jgi:aspartate kinase